ncbi:hypothetical protein [Candidatus Pyrohabitans sp.]
MLSKEFLKEVAGNVSTKGDFLMLNVEFIENSDLEHLPGVVDRLLKMEGVSTVLVYGIKGSVVYLAGRSTRGLELANKLKHAFPGLCRVKETNGYVLAVIPLGMLGYFNSQEKVLQVVDELMNDALAGGAATRGFGTVFERVAGIKNLVNLSDRKQEVVW